MTQSDDLQCEIRKNLIARWESGEPNFRFSDLKDTDFSHMEMPDVDFSYSKLNHARFCCTELKAANFYSTNLRGADFTGARVGGANFTKANLYGAELFKVVGLVYWSNMGDFNDVPVAWYRVAKWGEPSLMINIDFDSSTPEELFESFRTDPLKRDDPRWQEGGQFWRDYKAFAEYASARLVPPGVGGGE